MSDEVKGNVNVESQDAVETAQWDKPAEIATLPTASEGIQSVLYRKDLASVALRDLPLPAEIAETTTVGTMGEYFLFIRDEMNIPEAVVINPEPVDKSMVPVAGGIGRRPQWIYAAIDACTYRYETLEQKLHQVLFDHNLAVAPHVKMTFKAGYWTAWDWYSGIGAFQPRKSGLPQKMLDKHNSISAILTGQQINVPFGLDKGLFDWFQEILDLPLEKWLTDREVRFTKLRKLQNAFTAGNDAMFARKHGVKVADVKLDPGIYKIFSPQGEDMGERTYDPTKEVSARMFGPLQAAGYTFEKLEDLPN